jgi:hypothetical protein
MGPTWAFTFRDYMRTGTDELGVPTFELCEEVVHWSGSHYINVYQIIQDVGSTYVYLYMV